MRKKKSGLKRKYYYKKKPLLQNNCSEGNFPEIVRCKDCMRNHFPGTKRFCQWSISKENKKIDKLKNRSSKIFADTQTSLNIDNCIKFLENKIFKDIPRSRGGAGNYGADLLISRAIQNAQKHGIKLAAGTLNNADGNCAFEAVIVKTPIQPQLNLT